MIQMNLLPDVKLEYIKAQRQRRLVIAASALAAIVAILLLISTVVIGQVQKKYLSDLNSDIKKETAQLKAKPDITKILTVQNQLDSLSTLHDQKPAANKVFEYLNQITPTDTDITRFSIDFTANTIAIEGRTDSISSVNKYIDTLKYTKYITDGDTESATQAFSSVVLSGFGLSKDTNAGNKAASFNTTFSYDPLIFDITKKVALQVPKRVTTRASINSVDDLFTAAPAGATTQKVGN